MSILIAINYARRNPRLIVHSNIIKTIKYKEVRQLKKGKQ